MDLFSSSSNFVQLACSTCMSGTDDVNTRAAGWSILFLLAVILPVLGGLIGFAFHLRKASRQAAIIS